MATGTYPAVRLGRAKTGQRDATPFEVVTAKEERVLVARRQELTEGNFSWALYLLERRGLVERDQRQYGGYPHWRSPKPVLIITAMFRICRLVLAPEAHKLSNDAVVVGDHGCRALGADLELIRDAAHRRVLAVLDLDAVLETTTPHQPNMLARRHWLNAL